MIKKQLILIYRTHRVFSIALFLLFKHFKIFMTYLYFNNVFVYLERDF
jgi:catabolite regulation protein CreA